MRDQKSAKINIKVRETFSFQKYDETRLTLFDMGIFEQAVMGGGGGLVT